MTLPNHAQTKAQAAPGDPFVKKADNPEGKEGAVPWRNCLLVLEVYSLDKNDAFATLESERGNAARYRKVTDMAKAGKAKLEILTALASQNGQRSAVQGIDEVSYFTKFAPPTSKGAHATPTEHESRDVGDTLEFDPVLATDGKTCSVSLVPQHSSLVGFREDRPTETSAPVSLPVFSSLKTITQKEFPKNEPSYLCSLTPQAADGAESKTGGSQMWLAFVRLNVVGPTEDEMKPLSKKTEGPGFNFDYSIYSLDRAAAKEVLTAMPGIDAPWNKLQGFLGEKKARFEQNISMQTLSGHMSFTQALQEGLYPAKYTTPTRPTTEENISRTTSTTRNQSKKQNKPEESDQKDGNTEEVNEVTSATRGIPTLDAMPGVPDSLESREAGMEVQCEPVVADDGLSISLTHVVNSVEIADLKTTGLAASYPVLPVFTTQKVTSQQMVLAGHHMLVGTFNPPGATGVNGRVDTGRTWLLFVRATPDEP